VSFFYVFRCDFKPYLTYCIGDFKKTPLWFHFSRDMMFIIGIFDLGGNFWDKLSGLFQDMAKIARDY